MKHTTKLLSVIMAIGMILGVFSMLGPISAGAVSAAYDGTPVTPTKISSSTYESLGLSSDKWEPYDGYYAIRTASELYGFANIVNGGDTSANAVLLDDIVVNSGTVNENGATYKWVGIGSPESSSTTYKGTFDGNGHYVSGLYYKPDEGVSESYVGFFRVISGATVKNIILKNSYFYAESNVGAISGRANTSTSNIINCRIESDVTVVKGGENQVPYLGGILGGCPLGRIGTTMPIYCLITNCVFLGTIRAMTSDFLDSDNNRAYIGSISGTGMPNGNAFSQVRLSNCFARFGCIEDKNGNNTYKSGSSTFVFNVAKGGGFNDQGYWGDSQGCVQISSASDAHDPVVGEHIALKAGDSDYKYCVVCDKKIATITVTAPASYVIPGTSMELTATADYSEITSFSVVSGTNYTANGMTIKTSEEALVGSEISVKVTGVDTDAVHAHESTVTFKVGVLDSSAEINEVQEKLDNALASLTESDDDLAENIEALRSAMTAAQYAITTLQNNSATKAQLTTLENTLKQADSEITTAYTKAINEARGELEDLIDAAEEAAINGDKALEITLREHIAEVQGDLEDLIDAAEEAAINGDKALETTLREHIAEVQGDLEDLIDAAEEAAINGDKALEATLREHIAEVQGNLKNLIAAAEKAAINSDNAIKHELTKAIEAAIKTAEAANAALEEKLQEKIDGASQNAQDANDVLEEKLQGNITDAIKKAEDELNSANEFLQTTIAEVQKELDKAIADLDAAMKSSDSDLSAQIVSLNTALANAKAALEATDAANRSELEDKIDKADAALKSATDALSDELNNVKNELESAKSELANKDSELQTFIIIVCVVSGVAFCGCGTLAVFYVIDKTKKR